MSIGVRDKLYDTFTIGAHEPAAHRMTAGKRKSSVVGYGKMSVTTQVSNAA